MLLTAIALFAQTAPTLPSLDDRKQAALTCGVAATMVSLDKSAMRRSAQMTHYLLQAADSDPGTVGFMQRSQELATGLSAIKLTREQADGLIPRCDQLFPNGRVVKQVALPSDAVERDVLCFLILSMFQGSAEELQKTSGDPAPLANITAAIAPYEARVTDDVLAKRGLSTSDLFMTYSGNLLRGTINKAGPESYARACGAAPF